MKKRFYFFNLKFTVLTNIQKTDLNSAYLKEYLSKNLDKDYIIDYIFSLDPDFYYKNKSYRVDFEGNTILHELVKRNKNIILEYILANQGVLSKLNSCPKIFLLKNNDGLDPFISCFSLNAQSAAIKILFKYIHNIESKSINDMVYYLIAKYDLVNAKEIFTSYYKEDIKDEISFLVSFHKKLNYMEKIRNPLNEDLISDWKINLYDKVTLLASLKTLIDENEEYKFGVLLKILIHKNLLSKDEKIILLIKILKDNKLIMFHKMFYVCYKESLELVKDFLLCSDLEKIIELGSLIPIEFILFNKKEGFLQELVIIFTSMGCDQIIGNFEQNGVLQRFLSDLNINNMIELSEDITKKRFYESYFSATESCAIYFKFIKAFSLLFQTKNLNDNNVLCLTIYGIFLRAFVKELFKINKNLQDIQSLIIEDLNNRLFNLLPLIKLETTYNTVRFNNSEFPYITKELYEELYDVFFTKFAKAVVKECIDFYFNEGVILRHKNINDLSPYFLYARLENNLLKKFNCMNADYETIYKINKLVEDRIKTTKKDVKNDEDIYKKYQEMIIAIKPKVMSWKSFAQLSIKFENINKL